MSRNIYEPSDQRDIAVNRNRIKTTRQKPEAFQWWTPECTLPADAAEGCTGNEPPLQNSFVQPSAPLDPWAFRLKVDGDLQFKGVLDASSATSGTVVVTLPGINAGEVDFVPEKDSSYPTWVTLDGSEIIAAGAQVDSTTGEVTVSWGGGGDSPFWAMVSTQDTGFQTDGTDTWIDFYTVFLSGDAAGFFGFEVDVGGGQFGDDRVFLTMNQSGIYTFTWQLITSDLAGAAQPAFAYQARLNVLGGSAGVTGGGETDRFPGQFALTPLVQTREQFYVNDSSGDDLWLSSAITLPLKHPNPGTERRCGELKLMYTTQPGADEFWSARVWVVRHGPLVWGATDFDQTNATWQTGDPVP